MIYKYINDSLNLMTNGDKKAIKEIIYFVKNKHPTYENIICDFCMNFNYMSSSIVSYIIGLCYEYGYGVNKNDEREFYYKRFASECDNFFAYCYDSI